MRSSRSASNGASIPPGGVATWNVSAIGVTRTPRTAKRCATAAFSDSISASAEIITGANHPGYMKVRGSQGGRSQQPEENRGPDSCGGESEAGEEGAHDRREAKGLPVLLAEAREHRSLNRPDVQLLLHPLHLECADCAAHRESDSRANGRGDEEGFVALRRPERQGGRDHPKDRQRSIERSGH